MPLAEHVGPWRGVAYRHVPADSPFDVLDFRFAGRDPANRWNAGEPTLYLASDPETAMVELARHFRLERTPGLAAQTAARRMYRLEVVLDAVLDLTAPAAWRALALSNAPYCFLDKAVARATAGYARAALAVQAIRVPSMGFLDQSDHWCLVVFLERVSSDPRGWIGDVRPEAEFRVELVDGT